MNRIRGGDESASEAAIPKGERHDTMPFLFATQPLNQKAHAKHGLAEKSNSNPNGVGRIVESEIVEMLQQGHYNSLASVLPR